MVTLAAHTDTFTLDPAQQQRTERAWQGLTGRAFIIQRIGPSQWSVKNGDKLPYAVQLNDGLWSCTCPDFQKIGPEIRCKHVEAVRIAETQQTYPITYQENTTMPTTPSIDFEHILTELCQPLDMTRVKRRQVPERFRTWKGLMSSTPPIGSSPFAGLSTCSPSRRSLTGTARCWFGMVSSARKSP